MHSYWESEKIFYDGDLYFDQLIQDIDQSKQFISIEMYIFNDDVIGKKITNHLLSAAKRGVKIQIIVDGVGSYAFFDNLHHLFKKNEIIVKIYNPLPFYHPYYGKLSYIKKLQVFGLRMWRLNRRNHRKIITIDHTIMYAGSFNITIEHTHFHSEKPWKDIGMRVTGDHVKFAVLNFKRIWKLRDYYRYKRSIKNQTNLNWRQSPLRLNQSLFMKRFFYKSFLDKINKSEKRVWLMTPYFIPKRRFIRAIGKAAERGVDVRILISFRTDVTFFKWLQYFYYDYLIKKGVRVYQYTETVLHAKSYIVDDFITVGSTNLNHRSFMHDLEFDLAVENEQNKQESINHFLENTLSQEEITLYSLSLRPFWDKLLSRVFFLFKYWF